jgi:hypothetical protein
MKKEYLFTERQKQIVINNSYEFGKFFSNNNLRNKSYTPSDVSNFKNCLKRNIICQSSQLGILFAYHIATKNFDYFIEKQTFDFRKYIKNDPTTGWSGFANYIFQSLQKCNTDKEVKFVFEELYYKIF